MKVFVLTVSNVGGLGEMGYDEGGPVLTELFTSYELAYKYLAAYCRGDWENQGGHVGHLSLDDATAIEQYFDFWGPEIEWDISEKETDPDPAAVDHSPEFAAGPAEEDEDDEIEE